VKPLQFLPPAQATVRLHDLVRLPSACLAQSAKDQHFKRLTGWRGLASCTGTEAFTCRIAERPGVYGLAAAQAPIHSTGESIGESANESTRAREVCARFHMFYFPDPDEPLVDRFSLAAAMIAFTRDYREMCRDFPRHEAEAAMFYVGSVELAMANDGKGLALRLCSEGTRRTIAEDGVRTDSGEWVIEPGQPDEDLPTFEIGRDFFSTLCSAITFCAEEPPLGFSSAQAPCVERRYKADGAFTEEPAVIHYPSPSQPDSPAVCPTTHCLAWGSGIRLSIFSHQAAPLQVTADGKSPGEATPFPNSAAQWTPGLCLVSDSPAELPAGLPDFLKDELYWKIHDLNALQQTGNHKAAFDQRPRLVVLSGFLGSGKTTFLNQFIEYNMARDQFVAIIQNEVGETGVDASLLEGDDSVVEMDEGCVCCTLAGNLAGAIEKLTGRYRPEVIVLETTGLANPRNLLAEIDSLAHLVRLDAIVTLVDADQATNVLQSSEIAREQIRGADVLVMNKCDLATPEQLQAIRREMEALNANVPMVEAVHGHVNFGLLFDDRLHEEAAGVARKTDSASALIPHYKDVHHTHRHATHADEGFANLRFALTERITPQALYSVLDSCRDARMGAYRIKGIFRSAEDDQGWVLQYVGGRYEISPLGMEFDDTPFVVLIGQNIPEDAMRDVWQPLIGEAR
jgi:G3E family GTPase